MTDEDVTAVVLAGGESRRFDDGHKALRTIDGRPLLAHVLATAREISGETPLVAVANDNQRETYRQIIYGPVRFVTDPPGYAGPLAGLAGATTTASTPWLFVVGCDMPFLSPEVVGYLGARRASDVDAVVPRTPDGIHPLHAWYRRAPVKQALQSGLPDQRIDRVFDRISVRYVRPDSTPDPADFRRSVFNINTVGELENARETFET